MKKLLLTLFIILSIFQLKAKIPGINSHYSTNSNTWDDGSKIYWNFTECSHSLLIIGLDQPDEMYLELNGNIVQSFGYTSSFSIDKFQLGPYQYGNYNFTLRGTSSGILCSLQVESHPSQLTNIRVETNYDNNINGDTIIVCSEFNRLQSLTVIYEFDYGFQSGDHYTFKDDQFAYIYINGVKQSSKILSELNIKTGDTLQVKREQGNFNPHQCSAYQIEPELTTDAYIVKVVENPKVAITAVLEGDTVICPGDSVILGQTVATTKNFVWHNQSAQYSSKDTSIITTPGQYRLIEYNTPNSTCAAVSDIHNIVKGTGCKGYVNGYVRENGSYNSQTGLYNTFPGVTVKTSTGLVTVSDAKGFFEFRYDSINDFSTIYVADPDYYAGYDYTFTDNNFMLDVNNYLYTYLLQTNDLAVQLNSGRNRPGFTIPYYVNIENRGKNSLTTDVKVKLDSYLTYAPLMGGNLPDLVLNDELYWNQITVASGETKRFTFYAVLDRLTPLGTELNLIADLTQTTEDDVPANDQAKYVAEVTGSFDPNDKLVSYNGAFTEGYVYDTTQFEYTIRFQNTGTDTAFNIRVVDIMPIALDLTSLEIIDASHNYIMEINGNTVTWLFNNIMLPDSIINEPKSHGFIRFKIDQKKGNQSGTVIANKADIYFDFNDPIITNEVVSIVDNRIVTGFKTKPTKISNNEFIIYPNPAKADINFNQEGDVVIFNQLGAQTLSSKNTNQVNVSELPPGIYYVKFKTTSEERIGTFIKQ